MNSERWKPHLSQLSRFQTRVAEWRRINPIVAEQRVTSTAGAAFFHSHDACHVVFGLDAVMDLMLGGRDYDVLQNRAEADPDM